MLIIRLQRIGTHKKPVYRLVINEKAKTTQGNVLEILGSYNPHTKEFAAKDDRIKYWISVGAQCSATVNNLLISKGIKKGEKVTSWKPKKKQKDEEVKDEKKPDKSSEAKEGNKETEKPTEDKKEENK